MPEDVGLPAGHDPQQSLGDAHVPVGLGARRHLRWIVGSVLPDRVDREHAAHEGGDTEDDEEEAAGLGRVDREHRVADHVLLGASGSGPLRVLVVDDQQQVERDQRQDQARDQQHVRDVEPRDDQLARELATEHEERHVGADDRRCLHEAVGDPHAGAREQVVGQRVAGEALEDAQDQQQRADDPVDLARLAERAGEEDAHHVDEHRGDEQHRGPVVHLPHEQSAADVERDVEGRGVGLGHVDAAELVVAAHVGDLTHARHEPQGQERAGQQQDDEAPQGDLAEHERPVVREDLAHLRLGELGQAEAVVDRLRRPPTGDGFLAVAAVVLLAATLLVSMLMSSAPRSWVRPVQ